MSYEEGERDFVVNASFCTLTALINASSSFNTDLRSKTKTVVRKLLLLPSPNTVLHVAPRVTVPWAA
jgi:hypothetical protein